MARTELRNRAGTLLGWREDQRGRVEGRDRTGRLVGWYDPRRGETRDNAGVLRGRGDLLASLITSAL